MIYFERKVIFSNFPITFMDFIAFSAKYVHQGYLN